MDKQELAKKISESLMTHGDMPISEIPIESADPSLLDIRYGDFNEHVAIQPSALAYFQVLHKTAERNLKKAKESFKKWKDNAWIDAKKRAKGLGKSTVQDIETQLYIDNKAEIEKYEQKIDEAQFQVDTFGVYSEAWKQKGFVLLAKARMMQEEHYYQSDNISVKQPSSMVKKASSSMEKAKSLIRSS